MSATKALTMLWACAVMVLAVGTAHPLPVEEGTSSARDAAVRQWFNRMDTSRDGQLQELELRQFIGAQLGPADFNTGRELDRAVEQVTEKLDGEDFGFTISVNELDRHLHTVLEGVKVSDWVSHSLGLPMYAEAFRENSITVLDFPLLVNDGGKLLETELSVTRVLHRQKIMRAMQRQMLGLSVEPGPIVSLQCSSSSGRGSGHAAAGVAGSSVAGVAGSSSQHAGAAEAQRGLVHCMWVQPDTPGEPSVHKYVLERYAMHRPGATWQTAAELDDTVMTQFSEKVESPGVYQYRVAAWNVCGRSPYAFSGEVLVPATTSTVAQQAADTVLPDPAVLLQHQQQQASLQQDVTTGSAAGIEKLKNAESDVTNDVQMSDSKHDSVPTASGRQATQRIPTATVALDYQHDHQSLHQQQQQHADELPLGAPPCQLQQVAQQDVASAVVHAPHGILPPQETGGGSALNKDALGSDSDSLPNHLVRYAGLRCSSTCSSSSSCSAQHAPATALAPACQETSCSNLNSWNPSNSATGVGGDSHNSYALVAPASNTAATAAAAQSPATAAPTIVWVVGQGALTDGSPSTPTAVVAQVQLLRSMQAAAGIAVAEAAAGQSSQANSGQGNVGRSAGSLVNKTSGKWSATALFAAWAGKWLKGLINSLLLLVLPACVRLLPVPVLHKLAGAVARALQLLPQPLQRPVHRLCSASGVERHQQQPHLEAAGADATPAEDGVPVHACAVGGRVVKTLTSSSSNSILLSDAAAAVGNSSSVAVPDSAAVIGSSMHTGAGIVGECAAGADEAGVRVVHSPNREELVSCGVVATPRSSGRVPAGMMKSRSEVGLVGLLWPNSPVSNSAGRLLAPAAAASPATAVAGAGSYTGIYGLAWQTGPMAAAPAAAEKAIRTSPEIQAVYATMAPDTVAQQQRQQEQFLRTATAASWAACLDSSSPAGQCCLPEELGVTKMPNRKRCAFPGCSQQFDLRHLRALMQRHYCGRCQQAFCLAHTAYSPHGPGGGCGAESRCVCCSCIFDFTPEYRSFLMSRNMLQNDGSRRTRSGPPVGRGSNSDNGARCSLAIMHARAAQQQAASSSKCSPVLQPQKEHAAGWLQLCASRSSDGSRSASSRSAVVTRELSEATAPAAAAAGSTQMKSRMLWSRAWTKASAVVRLTHSHGQKQYEQKQSGDGGR